MNIRPLTRWSAWTGAALLALLLAACGGGGSSNSSNGSGSGGGGGGGGGGSNPPSLVSIAVTPANPSVASGATLQMVATGTYSDGTSQAITSTVTWSSDATGKATVNSSSGLVTGVATGSANITATLGSVSGHVAITVTAAVLQTVTVEPVNPTVPAGLTQQFTATGTYTDGTSQDVSGAATWASTDTTKATVNSAGLATAVAAGSAHISATVSGISGQSLLTVTAANLVSINVTGGASGVPAGLTQQMTATGVYSDGSQHDLTTQVTWASGTTAAATISGGGLLTGVAVGQTSVTATLGSVSGNATVNVTAALLQVILVAPDTPSAAAGTTLRFYAFGNYSDGSTADISANVTWTSSATSYATVDSTGLASAVAAGQTTIGAALGSLSGSTVLTVTPATLVSISLSPATPTITLLQSQSMVATGNYSDGSSQSIPAANLTWSSGTTSVATITSAGLAKALTMGSTVLTATYGTGATSVAGSATLTVAAPTETLLHSFGGAPSDGDTPDSGLLLGADGNLYGTTYVGGLFSHGSVYGVTKSGSNYSTSQLYSFGTIVGDGQGPYGGLAQDSNGTLYGMTLVGGSTGFGTLYSLQTSGASEAVLHTFAGGSDGKSPYAAVTVGSDGNLYGMTGHGGTDNYGVIFSVPLSGTGMTVIHTFTGTSTDGEVSYGSLLQATDGYLYGVTNTGGLNTTGIVFRVAKDGTGFADLHDFASGSGAASDGRNPYGSLMQASDGNIYGMTYQGGTHNQGVIFRYAPATGVYTVIYNFTGGVYDGGGPQASLMQASDGNLYGTALNGGANSSGVVFQLTLSGSYSVIYNFAGGSSDGASPRCTLVQGADGNLYGTTIGGGTSSKGTVFMLN